MKTFYVWITLLTEGYVDTLVTKAVRRGYAVTSLSGDGNLTLKNKCSVLVALELTASEAKLTRKALTPAEVLNEMKTLIGEIGLQYHSIIISEPGSGCTWNIGNIVPPAPPPAPEPTRFDKVGSE